MAVLITLYNAATKKCNQVTLYNATDVSLLALQHRNLKCKQTNSGVPAPLRCFEAQTLFGLWTRSIERTIVIMNFGEIIGRVSPVYLKSLGRRFLHREARQALSEFLAWLVIF